MPSRPAPPPILRATPWVAPPSGECRGVLPAVDDAAQARAFGVAHPRGISPGSERAAPGWGQTAGSPPPEEPAQATPDGTGSESEPQPSNEASRSEGEGGPHSGFVDTTKLQFRVNPLGVLLVSDTGYRVVLFHADSLLLQGTQLDVGVTSRLSPVFALGGPYVEVTPVAFLKLRAEVTPGGYFGILGYLHEFASRNDDWSPDRIDQIQRDDLGHSASGWRALVGGTLQLLVERVAALFENSYTWYWMDVQRPYYEGFESLLLEPSDAVWTMAGTLGYVFGADPDEWYLLVAARYDRQQTRDTDFTRQALGGLLLWKIPEAWWSWGKPEVAALLETYVEDPYITGELTFAFELSLHF
jgi:hypothetical protein